MKILSVLVQHVVLIIVSQQERFFLGGSGTFFLQQHKTVMMSPTITVATMIAPYLLLVEPVQAQNIKETTTTTTTSTTGTGTGTGTRTTLYPSETSNHLSLNNQEQNQEHQDSIEEDESDSESKANIIDNDEEASLKMSTESSTSITGNLQHEEEGKDQDTSGWHNFSAVTSSASISGIEMAAQLTTTASCNETQVPFLLELKPDQYPNEISWQLKDINKDEIIQQHPDNGKPYEASTIYNQTICVEKEACIKFIIEDEYDDGICCSNGIGYYYIFYDDMLIKSGGEYASNDTAIIGDSCASLTPSQIPSSMPSPLQSSLPSSSIVPSSKPSKSSMPSLSLSVVPSSKPSPLQSSYPTMSQSPSITSSKVPSSQPSTSSTPTSFPTQEFDSIAIDEYGRRYYPRKMSSQEQSESSGIYLNEPVPDCTQSSGRVGCIANPRSFVDIGNVPWWAGTLYQTPPVCTDAKSCNQGLPMSRKPPHSLSTTLYPANDIDNYLKLHNRLPGGSMNTYSIVVLGDINGDGLLDVVIGNYNQENQLLINSGNGTFSETIPVTLPGGNTNTFSIALGDVNGDGLLDVVIGNYNHPNQLLINSGNGTFSETIPITLPGGSMRTRSIALGDINGDGLLDVVIANYGQQENQLLINPGDGIFSEEIPLTLPGGNSMNSYSIVLGDINGDGLLDVVIGNYNQQENQLLVNSGNGTFSETIPVTLPGGNTNTFSIALGDVNGDGLLDVVIGNYNHPNQLLISSGNGTFFETIPVTLPGGSMRTRSIALGDVNGDGLLDVVIGNRDRENQLLINPGDGTFSETIPVTLPGGSMDTYSIALGDVNENGLLDVMIGNFNQENQLLINSYDDTFSETIPVALTGGNTNTFSIVLGDVNGDGFLDVVIGNYDQQVNQLLINSGDSIFSETIPVTLPGGSMYTASVTLGDVNGDGLLDVVIGNEGQDNQLLVNPGDGTFSETIPITLPGGSKDTRSIALGDVNGDGLLDVVIGNYGQQENQLLINSGNGTFSETIPITLPGGSMNTFSVALGDVNGDGLLDVVIGNYLNQVNQPLEYYGQDNQLLVNSGNGTFSETIPVTLPGGSMNTRSIALGDVNGDGLLDVVIGNYNQENQLLINSGNGTFSETIPVTLPGGSTMEPDSMVLGDINGDGLLDVVIGNFNQPNQALINFGNGTFSETIPVTLPGGSSIRTRSIALGDVNGDGLLDVVIGNGGQDNQVLYYTACQNGGARLHPKSWCFKCPSTMGQELNSPFCQECMPDFTSGRGERCDIPCTLGERKFGQDICMKCANGTFYDNSFERAVKNQQTLNRDRCVDCPIGTYANNDITAVNKCLSCNPGFYQPNATASQCMQCLPGTYQPEFGKDSCLKCPTGGYCSNQSSLNGGFTPCLPGTYNDLEGKYESAACQSCPIGTYSIKVEASNASDCFACGPGSYSNETGASSCILCKPGTFQNEPNQASCNDCNAGTYSDKKGFEECNSCPYRLNSGIGNTSCPVCDRGFYLNDMNINATTIFKKPSVYCKACPDTVAACEVNTSIVNLGIKPGFWRRTRHTTSLYSCKSNTTCIGTNGTVERDLDLLATSNAADDTKTGIYCAPNHTGPLCEVCIADDYYFNEIRAQCVECPAPLQITGILVCILVGVSCLLSLIALFIKRFIPSLISIGPRAKLKIFITFYQVIAPLQDVYGVTLSSRLKGLVTNALQWFSLDILEIFNVPVKCLGTTIQQLLMSTLWPFILIGFVVIGLSILYMIRRLFANVDKDDQAKLNLTWKKRVIQVTIVVIYFALPLVAQRIFDALKCRAFNTDDNETPSFESYLLIDMSIKCNADSENRSYKTIYTTFWILLGVWIIFVPIVFFLLLIYISPSIESSRITFLADACRFLWQDYNSNIWFWDIVDTMRKIFLTGIIMFIDIQEGSNKILRLVVANIVSALYMGILLAFHPYQMKSDYYLAFVSNFLLICCFTLGMILKLCPDETDANDSYEGFCRNFVGRGLDSFGASVLVLCLAFGMAIVSILTIAILTIRKLMGPTIRMVSTKQAPNLELPHDCESHIFMSHVWSTGQDKTHAIARKLQLLLPSLKVWLDVDSLTDISLLEDAVNSSAVFVLYYSEGYFRSRNCRREIYAAVEMNKPSILIFFGDESTILDIMKEECTQYCDSDKVESILSLLGHGNRTSTNGPIQWLDEGSFSAIALSRICHRIFRYLPHYINHQNELDQGIIVPSAIGSVSLQHSINILVLEDNIGCIELLDELKSVGVTRGSNLISIINASEYLQHKDRSDVEPVILDVDIAEENPPTSQEALENGVEKHRLLSTRLTSTTNSTPTFMLLYLNDQTFNGSSAYIAKLVSVLKACLTSNSIQLVLVNEKDVSKGGCDFGDFIGQAPQELLNPPYTIFKNIAIPLYEIDEYRIVSLRQILSKMGATQGKHNKFMKSVQRNLGRKRS